MNDKDVIIIIILHAPCVYLCYFEACRNTWRGRTSHTSCTWYRVICQFLIPLSFMLMQNKVL